MINFKTYLKNIKENNISGIGGVFGDTNNMISNEDPRIPFVLGTFKKNKKRNKKKRNKKK